MRIKSIIAVILVLASVLSVVGCSKEEKTESVTVFSSEHFTFSEEMVYYMVYYTRMMLKNEMLASGVNTTKPLKDQIRSEGETWEDYLYEKVNEGIEKILVYCEAAYIDDYKISEGMSYKSSETVTYLSNIASEMGVTPEEYVKDMYGEKVTLDGFRVCTEMLALCEGYEMDYLTGIEVSDEEAQSYAEENPDELLKFSALRYSTTDSELADKLAAASNTEEFVKALNSVSGLNRTDTNKNSIPDFIEIIGISVAADEEGEFAKKPGIKIGSTTTSEKNGTYTVTMMTSLPVRNMDVMWDFRMLYMSDKSSSNPTEDLTSLIDQWKKKEGGETGFANLCARYSDDPSAYYGGLYSNTATYDMPSELVSAWVCDLNRQPGDTVVLTDDNNGAYMLYYIDGLNTGWAKEAETLIRNNKMEEKIASMEDGIKEKFSIEDELMRQIVEDAVEINDTEDK